MNMDFQCMAKLRSFKTFLLCFIFLGDTKVRKMHVGGSIVFSIGM